MSIYGSFFAIEDEREWIADLRADGIAAGVIRDGEPTGEDFDAPIVYQGSHVLPEEADRRGGFVGLALIPSHITRDGRDDQPEDSTPWPYLRLDVAERGAARGEGGAATVVITVAQAARFRDALSEWIGWAAPPEKEPT